MPGFIELFTHYVILLWWRKSKVSENLDCDSEIVWLVTRRDFMTLRYSLVLLHSVLFVRCLLFRISCTNQLYWSYENRLNGTFSFILSYWYHVSSVPKVRDTGSIIKHIVQQIYSKICSFKKRWQQANWWLYKVLECRNHSKRITLYQGSTNFVEI